MHDLRILLVAYQFVTRRRSAANKHNVVRFAVVGNGHGPSSAASCVPRGDMRGDGRIAERHSIPIGNDAVHLDGRKCQLAAPSKIVAIACLEGMRVAPACDKLSA